MVRHCAGTVGREKEISSTVADADLQKMFSRNLEPRNLCALELIGASSFVAVGRKWDRVTLHRRIRTYSLPPLQWFAGVNTEYTA